MLEQRRQTYLSLLGIESYIPRWTLDGAKVSSLFDESSVEQFVSNYLISEAPTLETIDEFTSQEVNSVQGLKSVDSIFSELTAVKEIFNQEPPHTKPAILINNDNQILRQSVKPFSFSLWRFESGLMIVDSRDTKQALPTDLLLQNFINQIGLPHKLPSVEIIHWPLVTNRFTALTEQDARVEMQTWLSVQKEIHGLKYLWVMGDLAATHLLPESESYQQLISGENKLSTNNIMFLVTQSLNELLLNPLQKKSMLKILKILAPSLNLNVSNEHF